MRIMFPAGSIAQSLASAGGGCFSIPDRSQSYSRQAGGKRFRPRVIARPVRAGGLPDELGEARAEGAQRGAADLRNDEVAAPQQGHGPLDAPHLIPPVYCGSEPGLATPPPNTRM